MRSSRKNGVLGKSALDLEPIYSKRYFPGKALDSILVTPVNLPPMPRAQQHSALRRSLLVFAIASTIAFLLLFSVTLASSAGDGFYHITLDLPVFFLLLVLTACISDWFQADDAFFRPKPAAPAAPTRAPPASFL